MELNSVNHFLEGLITNPKTNTQSRYSAMLLLGANDQARMEKLKDFTFDTIRQNLSERRNMMLQKEGGMQNEQSN